MLGSYWHAEFCKVLKCRNWIGMFMVSGSNCVEFPENVSESIDERNI